MVVVLMVVEWSSKISNMAYSVTDGACVDLVVWQMLTVLFTSKFSFPSLSKNPTALKSGLVPFEFRSPVCLKAQTLKAPQPKSTWNIMKQHYVMKHNVPISRIALKSVEEICTLFCSIHILQKSFPPEKISLVLGWEKSIKRFTIYSSPFPLR